MISRCQLEEIRILLLSASYFKQTLHRGGKPSNNEHWKDEGLPFFFLLECIVSCFNLKLKCELSCLHTTVIHD
eukprot:m.11739 g.11739  ORF g.11739 m.11739 type:complete len:73 (-) comp3880_c0_seq1:536-754(-)